MLPAILVAEKFSCVPEHWGPVGALRTALGITVTALSTVVDPQLLLIVALTVKLEVTELITPVLELIEAPPERME